MPPLSPHPEPDSIDLSETRQLAGLSNPPAPGELSDTQRTQDSETATIPTTAERPGIRLGVALLLAATAMGLMYLLWNFFSASPRTRLVEQPSPSPTPTETTSPNGDLKAKLAFSDQQKETTTPPSTVVTKPTEATTTPPTPTPAPVDQRVPVSRSPRREPAPYNPPPRRYTPEPVRFIPPSPVQRPIATQPSTRSIQPTPAIDPMAAWLQASQVGTSRASLNQPDIATAPTSGATLASYSETGIPTNYGVAIGTQINGTLVLPIVWGANTQAATPDSVIIQLNDPLIANGTVLLPQGSHLVGDITQTNNSGHPQIAITKGVHPNGAELPIPNAIKVFSSDRAPLVAKLHGAGGNGGINLGEVALAGLSQLGQGNRSGRNRTTSIDAMGIGSLQALAGQVLSRQDRITAAPWFEIPQNTPVTLITTKPF